MSESEGNLTTADAEIDLYADVVENELETDTADTYNPHAVQDPDLYDDVITTQPSTGDFTDITNTVNQTHVKHDPSNENIRQTSTPNNVYNGRRFSMYVGQLTWWTTDADLAEAIQEIGVKDLLEVKFHENRVNGQSKGFAVVTVGSDASYRTMQEKLPKREIHGQNAIVLPCTKQSLNQLEPPTRKEGPMESMAPPMGVPPLRPMMRPPLGLPLPMPRGGPMDHPYRYPHQAPVLLPGGPPGMARGAMPMSLAPRPGAPMVLGRMPGPHAPPGVHPQQSVLVMQRAGVPPAPNPPGMVRPGGVPVSSNSMSVMSAVHPQGYYPAQPGQPVPAPHALSLPGQTHVDPYYRGVDIRHDPSANLAQITDAEFQEIMEKNKTVSTSAINRAVEDASNGDFATAIETLVTAISLIKQSKIANDDRCKILIGSLQDTLKGIEDKSYGQRARHRSRSGSPRESSRKKHRHRSRSPRDRNEYRRNEDYDSKYNREHRRR